jgi:hypothetical protein
VSEINIKLREDQIHEILQLLIFDEEFYFDIIESIILQCNEQGADTNTIVRDGYKKF